MHSLKNRPFLTFVLCLAALLAVLFLPSFNPSKVHFSNDGPLGAVHSAVANQPTGFTGLWFDLNTIGNNGGSYFLAITPTLLWLLGPLLFAKFYVPIVLAIVGLCAWFCFRQLQLTAHASLLAALAAVLASSYFSATCWGVGPHVIAAGMSFFAVGVLSDLNSRKRWLKVVLAGFAVGLGIMEGFDLGAIYSLLVAAWVAYQALTSEGSLGKRAVLGVGRLAVVTVCAAFLAFQAVTGLISTQIKGVTGMQQDAASKLERWDQATQWSLPKREAFSLFIPGLFGYRMETPKGGNYWGAAGRDPAWDRYFAAGSEGIPPQGFLRYTGGGNYLGVIVVLIAIWGALQGFRKQNSVFSLAQRKQIWFWAGCTVVCLLLAFGRHAPFYQVLYALPYFSTIRNPAKFLHILTFAVVMLFGFGLHGLSRRYLQEKAQNLSFGSWWAKCDRFEKGWFRGSIVAIALGLVGWLVYASSRTSLESYLMKVQFDETTARQIAGFSIGQVGWFLLLLIISVGLLTLILRGRFAGKQAGWAAALIGLLLCVDLGLANRPWIKYWNWRQKYATNPLIEFLRQKPYEQRVAIFPMDRFLRLDRLPPEAQPVVNAFNQLNSIYRVEWAQHHFQYFDIQSLDIVQMPRMPLDLTRFESAVMITPVRRWELTNTRYLLAPAPLLGMFNQQLDPGQQRFRILERFDVVPKPGEVNLSSYEQFTAVVNTNGMCALFEFTGALPRARLYSHWLVPAEDPTILAELKPDTLATNELDLLKQVGTNDFLTLKQLASPSLDPSQTVLLAAPLATKPAPITTNSPPAGTVEFASYSPKRIVLQAKAAAPAVLLLNDKYDPNWKVTVDGKPEPLLRCNYIMRGVQVPAGEHRVEFRFEPPLTGFYVSLTAIILGLGLVAFTFLPPRTPVPATKPVESVEGLKPAKR